MDCENSQILYSIYTAKLYFSKISKFKSILKWIESNWKNWILCFGILFIAPKGVLSLIFHTIYEPFFLQHWFWIDALLFCDVLFDGIFQICINIWNIYIFVDIYIILWIIYFLKDFRYLKLIPHKTLRKCSDEGKVD